jgi:hypothetical protein
MRWASIVAVLLFLSAQASIAATPPTPPLAPEGHGGGEAYDVTFGPSTGPAGTFGWSVLYETAGGHFGGAPLPVNGTIGPVVASDRWNGGAGTVGLVITSGAVAAISVDGGPEIATRPVLEAPYPYELRSAVYEVEGVSTQALRERKVRGSVVPLDSAGQPLAPLPAPAQPPGNPALETRSWEAPAAPARGVCRIGSAPFPGLLARSGSVVSVLRPLRGAAGRPELTCATTHYVLDGKWEFGGAARAGRLAPGRRRGRPAAAPEAAGEAESERAHSRAETLAS